MDREQDPRSGHVPYGSRSGSPSYVCLRGRLNPPATTPIAAGPTNLNASLTTLAGQDWIGKSSGFPPTFYKDCQGIMKQMFRCYAHLYHGHWLDPFWHINRHEMLNMCFVHFVTVAKYYKLVADKEMEPMQPLIDLYMKQEKIPPEAIAGHWASQEAAAASSQTPAANAPPS